MSYYVLESPVGPGNTLSTYLPYDGFSGSWKSGKPLAQLPPNPMQLVWNPENENGIRVAYYGAGEVLMSKDLISALRDGGVDNLETFPVEIRSQSSQDLCRDYDAVNIVGLIAAADMDASEVLDESGGMFDVIFESLVIDETKTNGALLFRLAESVSTVVIHESIAKALQEKGGFGLTFTEPVDYCG